MFLPVKLRFNGKGPAVYVESGQNRIKLDEDNVSMLDRIDIRRVDLDIRPYDDVIQSTQQPFRAAYLQSMLVAQETDRFAERFAEEEYPEE